MQPILPIINYAQETKRIVSFLKESLKKHNFSRVVLGLSGGIDSTTSFYLLKEAFPIETISVARLSYFKPQSDAIDDVLKSSGLPQTNIYRLSIKPMVDAAKKTAKIGDTPEDKLRLANIMARSRMIFLYDLAKKHNALVVGTENKSEMLLGYFTRFGDEASDIEPIRHLYKTQICQLAKHLGIPEAIIKQAPTAGLWTGQTDEKEFGFTYAEADQVLYLYFDKKLPLEEIKGKNLPNAEKIINHALQNAYKHHVPYSIKNH